MEALVDELRQFANNTPCGVEEVSDDDSEDPVADNSSDDDGAVCVKRDNKRFYLINEEELDIDERQPLSTGQSSHVYRAQWNGTHVAVKKLFSLSGPRKPGSGESKDPTEAIGLHSRELGVLSRIRHPHIIQFMGAVAFSSGHLGIVTELCKRGSLYDVMYGERHALNEREILTLASGVVRGLLYLHGLGFVHRDINPANVLVDADWMAKLADFGLSRKQDVSRVMSGSTGTFQYMAPEVLQGQFYDESVDMYSFGIMLWEMWEHRQPHSGKQAAQVILEVVNKGERPEVPASCPAPLLPLMLACWENDGDDRPTARSALELLEQRATDLALLESEAKAAVSGGVAGADEQERRGSKDQAEEEALEELELAGTVSASVVIVDDVVVGGGDDGANVAAPVSSAAAEAIHPEPTLPRSSTAMWGRGAVAAVSRARNLFFGGPGDREGASGSGAVVGSDGVPGPSERPSEAGPSSRATAAVAADAPAAHASTQSPSLIENGIWGSTVPCGARSATGFVPSSVANDEGTASEGGFGRGGPDGSMVTIPMSSSHSSSSRTGSSSTTSLPVSPLASLVSSAPSSPRSPHSVRGQDSCSTLASSIESLSSCFPEAPSATACAGHFGHLLCSRQPGQPVCLPSESSPSSCTATFCPGGLGNGESGADMARSGAGLGALRSSLVAQPAFESFYMVPGHGLASPPNSPGSPLPFVVPSSPRADGEGSTGCASPVFVLPSYYTSPAPAPPAVPALTGGVVYDAVDGSGSNESAAEGQVLELMPVSPNLLAQQQEEEQEGKQVRRGGGGGETRDDGGALQQAGGDMLSVSGVLVSAWRQEVVKKEGGQQEREELGGGGGDGGASEEEK